MEDFLISMALSILFNVLKRIVKNPASQAAMKAACLKLYKAIKDAYASDVDFE